MNGTTSRSKSTGVARSNGAIGIGAARALAIAMRPRIGPRKARKDAKSVIAIREHQRYAKSSAQGNALGSVKKSGKP